MADLDAKQLYPAHSRIESSRVSGGEPDSGQCGWQRGRRPRPRPRHRTGRSDAQPLCDDHHRCWITGMFITEDGRFFFNVQHPDANLDGEDEPGILGAVTGVDMNQLPRDSRASRFPRRRRLHYDDDGDGVPEPYDQRVRTALGDYQRLCDRRRRDRRRRGTGIGRSTHLRATRSPDRSTPISTATSHRARNPTKATCSPTGNTVRER